MVQFYTRCSVSPTLQSYTMCYLTYNSTFISQFSDNSGFEFSDGTLHCFVTRHLLSRIYALSSVKFPPSNYGCVKNMTNMRYAVISSSLFLVDNLPEQRIMCVRYMVCMYVCVFVFVAVKIKSNLDSSSALRYYGPSWAPTLLIISSLSMLKVPPEISFNICKFTKPELTYILKGLLSQS